MLNRDFWGALFVGLKKVAQLSCNADTHILRSSSVFDNMFSMISEGNSGLLSDII